MIDALWEILHLAWMMMTTYVVVRWLGVVQQHSPLVEGSAPSRVHSEEGVQ
jgi:hypothetical protein